MLVRMRAPVHCDGTSVGDRAYAVVDGFIEAADSDVATLTAGGFVVDSTDPSLTPYQAPPVETFPQPDTNPSSDGVGAVIADAEAED